MWGHFHAVWAVDDGVGSSILYAHDLTARGYPLRRSPLSYHFAGVHAIRLLDGKWDGGADPGRDGMALQV